MNGIANVFIIVHDGDQLCLGLHRLHHPDDSIAAKPSQLCFD
jgi:hypothetical protein